MSARATCGQGCGFDRQYASVAKAEYALRRHSCDRQRSIAERRARGEASRAVVDRTPKPCLHKHANHQHGTHACYKLDRCRCGPCSAATSAYEANRVRQQAYGRWTHWVDAEPARQHITRLTEQGMGIKRVTAAAGVSQGQMWKLLYGKKRPDGTRELTRRIHRDTEAKILAVTLTLAAGANVDATGTVRRLRALVALGWSQSKIAHRLGVLPSNLGPVVNGQRAEVLVATRDAVRALYDEWSMQLPPTGNRRDQGAATRARSYAQARGWLPPLAWDDAAIDDPDAGPLTGNEPVDDEDEAPVDHIDEAAVDRRVHGDKSVRLTAAECAEVIHRLTAAGWTAAGIERHTGLNVRRERLRAS
jgi:transcriptional regulator with XRE-family HTH domain